MFPKWYDRWNAANPTNVLGPAILVGAAGAAAGVAAIWWAIYEGPYDNVAMQTGPAGTGMHVSRFVSDFERQDPSIEAYFTLPANPPFDDELPSSEAYRNVQVLGDVSELNLIRLMTATVEWVGAQDVGCAYCHAGVTGNGFVEEYRELYAEDTLYTKRVARSMFAMTRDINENWSAHVNVNPDDGNVGVSCYTCHRGENVPRHVWFKLGPVTQAAAGWSANQNRATVQSQFTALPSDALEKYLLEANPINVHDLEPRVSRAAMNPATIQDTYRTYALMNYFSNSLGVNCTFCHNTRAFYDPAQNTPQWTNASLGILMVQEINNDWLVPLTDEFPPERLGPVFGDVAKTACATCHQGYQQPMHRLDMISDWPELATTGVPVYEIAE